MNCLPEPYYQNATLFTEYKIAIEMKKMETLTNKPFYLGLSVPELSKILIYGFSYDYVKEKYDEKSKLCNVDTDSFTVYLKTDDPYKYITDDVETKFYTSNYELDWPLSKGTNKKVIGSIKVKLGGKIIAKFVGL